MKGPGGGPVVWATSTHTLTGWANSLSRAQIALINLQLRFVLSLPHHDEGSRAAGL